MKKRIDIALQGGGAHGAFTWGVLDRLLEEPELEIVGISGTSAGAMNAVALAQGLCEGSPDRARELLQNYWTAVSDAAHFSPIQRTVLDHFWGRWSLEYSPSFILSQQFSRSFSPYQLNPLDVNPLRDIVEEVFDFDLINRSGNPLLFLSATNVRTGRPKVFRQPDLSVDAVMASACLPFMFKAVEIDGEAYWDGGYVGNPPLFPLIDETDARDVILVQINPFDRSDVPKTAYEIENRLNEITFNSSLISELRSIGFLYELIQHEGLEREAYQDARIHMIGAETEMQELSVSSKMNAERKFLRHLHKLGRTTSNKWLEDHWDDVGKKTTWKPRFVVEESIKPAHLTDDQKREVLD
ncbi:MAG: patatin-like phospholipase family protein [Roseibium sp.]